MSDVLNIVFHCFWHWLGSFLIVGAFGASCGSVFVSRHDKEVREHKEFHS